MDLNQFGTFSPLLRSAPGYLELLNLSSQEANQAVFSVAECCRKSADPYQEIGRLLDEPNWRCHIVAAVALSMLRYDEPAFIKLWAAFDSGSWVTPQLAVAAYLRDPGFSDNAKTRIESRCPVNTSRMLSMSPPERHSAAGPAGGVQRSAKAAAALVRLVSLTGQAEWLRTELSSPDLGKLVSEDIDRADEIAQHWLAALKASFQAIAINID